MRADASDETAPPREEGRLVTLPSRHGGRPCAGDIVNSMPASDLDDFLYTNSNMSIADKD
eukprot:5925747-Pyramimonas_sp.AAC.1